MVSIKCIREIAMSICSYFLSSLRGKSICALNPIFLLADELFNTYYYTVECPAFSKGLFVVFANVSPYPYEVDLW